jgi:hypothetical protein
MYQGSLTMDSDDSSPLTLSSPLHPTSLAVLFLQLCDQNYQTGTIPETSPNYRKIRHSAFRPFTRQCVRAYRISSAFLDYVQKHVSVLRLRHSNSLSWLYSRILNFPVLNEKEGELGHNRVFIKIWGSLVPSRNTTPFMEPECSFRCLQGPTNWPCN